MNASETDALQRKIGYRFRSRVLLQQALTHRSMGSNHNERLEFLGDSVLNYVISFRLYAKFPLCNEGEMTRIRSNFVRRSTLIELARALELERFLRFSCDGSTIGSTRNVSMLANAVEALIGAVCLDSDVETTKRLVFRWYSSCFKDTALDKQPKDCKILLQEFTQRQNLPLPVYRIRKILGKTHNQTFVVVCTIDRPKRSAVGMGSRKRQAEENAAGKILDALSES